MLIGATVNDFLLARSHARAIMIVHAVGAHREAYVALRDNERGRAVWVPSIVALLALVALSILAIATPER